MSWDNITGDAKILPSLGSGNVDEIKFESGKPLRVKLLLRPDEQPYSYLEHAIEHEIIGADGKTERQFRTIRCPKTANNPNAVCPICDGQRFRRRIRNAANVWDYEHNKVQKLNAGEGIWKPIATTRKLGVDVLNVDWMLMRTGTNRNDTEYTATNIGPSQPLTVSDELFNIEQEYAPHTIEEMKSIIESIGFTWDEIIVPPALTYPTLQDALNHVMPNGKYKDQSFKKIWESDQSSKGMINYLAIRSDRVTVEKAAAQVILVNLGGVNIPGVPKYNSNGAPAQMAQAVNTTPTPTPTPTAAQAAQAAANMATAATNTATATATATNTATNTATATAQPAGMSQVRKDKIDKINNIFSSNDKYVKGGFRAIMEAITSAGNGKSNISDFSDQELDKLLSTCQ